MTSRSDARRARRVRLVPDERDAVTSLPPAQLVHHLPRRVAGASASSVLTDVLLPRPVGKQRRRLLGTNERAGKDLVDVDTKPYQAFDGFLEPVDAGFGQRAFRIVRPLFAALRGDRVANEIQIAGFHASGGGRTGSNAAFTSFRSGDRRA